MGSSISNLVFQPPQVSYAHAGKHLKWIKTVSGVEIPAFFIDRKARVTILFSHGNAEDIGMVFEWFKDFTKILKVNILAYDYEGYGKTPGKPTEAKCYENIDAAFDYLTMEKGIRPECIILYGRSLGSGPSCYLAAKLAKQGVSLGGLVLQSALLSIYRVAFNFRYTMWGDCFSNIDRIGLVKCPVYIIHGTRDEIVPFWNGEDLFLAAPIQWRASPFWVENAGHNNIETIYFEDKIFFTRFQEFLDGHVVEYKPKGTNLGSQMFQSPDENDLDESTTNNKTINIIASNPRQEESKAFHEYENKRAAELELARLQQEAEHKRAAELELARSLLSSGDADSNDQVTIDPASTECICAGRGVNVSANSDELNWGVGDFSFSTAQEDQNVTEEDVMLIEKVVSLDSRETDVGLRQVVPSILSPPSWSAPITADVQSPSRNNFLPSSIQEGDIALIVSRAEEEAKREFDKLFDNDGVE